MYTQTAHQRNTKPNDSDSSGDEDNTTLMPGAKEELEGSATKYLQDELVSDEDGSEITPPTLVSETEPQENLVPTSGASGTAPKKIPKYVEVDTLKLSKDEQPRSKPPSSVEYVKLKPAPQVKVSNVPKASKVKSEPTRAVRGEEAWSTQYHISVDGESDYLYN